MEFANVEAELDRDCGINIANELVKFDLAADFFDCSDEIYERTVEYNSEQPKKHGPVKPCQKRNKPI